MNKEILKQEFINRYKYIYENIDIILLKNAKFMGKVIDYNLSLDTYLMIESFLLGDIPYKESELYKIIEENKKDSLLVNEIAKMKSYISDDEKRNIMYNLNKITKFYREVRNCILGQINNPQNRDNKLLALDEYYKVYRYNNNGSILYSGIVPTYKDFGPYLDKVSFVDKPIPHSKYLLDNDFINYLINIENHHKENNSILSEDEKQQIYLYYHQDEFPWNKTIYCNDCQSTSRLYSKLIYTKNGHDYYYICKKCGNIIEIDSSMLTQAMKNRIELEHKEDPQLAHYSTCHSELIKRNNEVVKEKALKRVFPLIKLKDF